MTGPDGTAALTVRYRDQDRANAAEGRWSLAEGELLVAEFGKTAAEAPLLMYDPSAPEAFSCVRC